MHQRETERFLAAIGRARAAGERTAIATVVRVKGNAYRREGTRMLVRENGTYECALSGGCLEPSVAAAAAQVIATGEPALITYDLADESLWALEIGCTGAVDIRIERLEDDALTREWLEILGCGDAAARVMPLAGASGTLIVRATGETSGGLADPVVQAAAAARALERLGAPRPGSGPETTSGAEIFYEVNVPPPALVIFGAGHDVPPVATLAWTLGFTVTIVDPREAFLTAGRFPHARLVPAHFSRFAHDVAIAPGAFVLVMNHHLERDRESLRFALESGAGCIGLLGPRSRYRKLLAGLAEEGYVPEASRLAAVRSPVGLSLGAETPEEVAVSILAEIMAIRRGFGGGFLSGAETSLHRSEDSRATARS